MSDLQLALLGVGAVVIAGVVAYNAFVERRARTRAEKAFGARHPDVLLSPTGERREPTLGALPDAGGEAAAPAAGIVPALADEEGAGGLEAPAGAGSNILARIDTIAVILADDPVTRERLDPLLDQLQGHTTPVNAEGIVDEQWQPVEASPRQSWRELRVALQLASRSGPVTEAEIQAFNEEIAAFAASVDAVSQRESPSAAAARALELDRFAAEVDIEVAVNVVGQFGATFSLARVKSIALAQGLAETGSGDLVSHAPDGSVAWAIRRFEREGARHESAYATGLSFALDVPHVADGPAAFDEMVELAQSVAATLGGELVDDNRKPLTAAGIAAIRRSIEQVAGQMQAHGVPAGSAAARRLFS